jgi:hypothetical protein
MLENTSESRDQQHPTYPWPRPGTDAVSLVTWSQYLRLWATELDRLAGGGEPGLFLGNYLSGLAEQALQLCASTPADHTAKAQIESEREAAWIAALEAEAADPGGSWVTSSEPDPEATGSLSGHPADEAGPLQVWLGDQSSDDTYAN